MLLPPTQGPVNNYTAWDYNWFLTAGPLAFLRLGSQICPQIHRIFSTLLISETFEDTESASNADEAINGTVECRPWMHMHSDSELANLADLGIVEEDGKTEVKKQESEQNPTEDIHTYGRDIISQQQVQSSSYGYRQISPGPNVTVLGEDELMIIKADGYSRSGKEKSTLGGRILRSRSLFGELLASRNMTASLPSSISGNCDSSSCCLGTEELASRLSLVGDEFESYLQSYATGNTDSS
ncbi:unnamed protein product [Protopolystoma xenopodis]|uniref:Uncharacterized protein n=1 Tax=Protopolystoma xenopodis TaxID=117903 RepID=A0A448WAH4_9PLAT|nr:unnamed protein product [Protopolystoma xenopodis]